MELYEIKDRLSKMSIPNNGYRIFNSDSNSYIGKDKNGNVVFLIESDNDKRMSFVQNTKELTYFFNKSFIFDIGGDEVSKTVHMLVCNVTNEDDIDIFLRLTKAFALNDYEDSQDYLTNLFISLKKLFSNEVKCGETELQGLYAELYAMLYFRNNGCDIVDYWQSKDKMKFDFSIDNKKRIEVKSTIKSNRIHKFRHEQLLSDLYDIKVISVMLQKNDAGYSLKDILNEVYAAYEDRIDILVHISQQINNIPIDELEKLKYDLTYTENNIGIYDALNIPHFNEENPEGVSHAEYDSDLTGIKQMNINDAIKWIKN